MNPQDLYKTMPMPTGAPMPLGDKPTATSGVVSTPNPPAVNSAPPGAPGKPTLPDNAINHGAIAPTIPTNPAPPALTPPAAPGGAAPSAPSGPPAPAYGSDIEGRINGYLGDLISGKGTPFNDSVMGKLRGRLFGAANGQADAAIGQAKDDAVKRGMFRSGLPTDAILAARAAAGQNYTKGEADLESQAAQANQGAQMGGIQALISQLQNSRQFNLGERQLAQSAPKGPNYNDELLSLIGGLQEPSFG